MTLGSSGDDPNPIFSNDELVNTDSPVFYLITIDNDSDVPVTVTSLVDDVYGTITDCAGVGVTVAVAVGSSGPNVTTTVGSSTASPPLRKKPDMALASISARDENVSPYEGS